MRGPGAGGRAARAAVLTWRFASWSGRRPPRLTSPRVVPGAGQPEPAAWTAAAAAAPRPPCTGSCCVPVPCRAARAASGSGARGKALGWEFAMRSAATRAPAVLSPSPTRGLLLSSGVVPSAPWRPSQEGPLSLQRGPLLGRARLIPGYHPAGLRQSTEATKAGGWQDCKEEWSGPTK